MSRFISRLKRDNYEVDKSIGFKDLIIVSISKTTDLIRGCWHRLFFQESNGLVFVGKGSQIAHSHLIKAGKTLLIGRNVSINALSRGGIEFGDNVTLRDNVIIECSGVLRNLGEKLVIGNNVGISQNCFIAVRGNVTIGDNTIIGPHVSIFSENHNFESLEVPIREQGEKRSDVDIGEDVWIGTKSTILSGVKIGSHSIVAAGSVVNKSIPEYSVVGGVPARVLKTRLSV